MNDKCSNGFREFDSHTTTKIINMKEEIRILQDWSLVHFDMIPITIKQLKMIQKEYNSYKQNTISIG